MKQVVSFSWRIQLKTNRKTFRRFLEAKWWTQLKPNCRGTGWQTPATWTRRPGLSVRTALWTRWPNEPPESRPSSHLSIKSIYLLLQQFVILAVDAHVTGHITAVEQSFLPLADEDGGRQRHRNEEHDPAITKNSQLNVSHTKSRRKFPRNANSCNRTYVTMRPGAINSVNDGFLSP